ncbi:hypothetical protein [Streptomyces mirabilis]|uniref:hypothetical protein n=1 Tax=Streptomyces mirabilis TaxID=68239 RepID=UPI0036E3EB3B
MTEGFAEAKQGPNAWAQAIAAVVMVGGLGAGLLVLQGVSEISASYDHLPVAQMADLLNTAQKRTVLGHPAVLYSERTIAITFNGDGKTDTSPGGIARSLVVAQDSKDGGGSYEIAIWRQDSVVPDDAALLGVAEKVLPTIPGWVNG